MSYGITPYGLGPYGAVEADLTIAHAVAVSTHVVRVFLTKEPQNISAGRTGDVFNPNTWNITRLDTGEGFTVLNVTKYDDTTWDIRVLEKFGSNNVVHNVASATLLDVGGSLIDSPRNSDFQGSTAAAVHTPDRALARQRAGARDFNNPFGPIEGSPGGTLIITSSGDYQLHGGADMVRKLIYRRLTTQLGAFWHLPNYGVGLRVKEPIPTGDLISLRAEIERQCRLEPEIAAVKATVRQDGNALTILVRASLQPDGQQVSLPIKIPFSVSL